MHGEEEEGRWQYQGVITRMNELDLKPYFANKEKIENLQRNEWRPMKNMFIGVGICQWKLWNEHLSIHSLMKKNITWENNPLNKTAQLKYMHIFLIIS